MMHWGEPPTALEMLPLIHQLVVNDIKDSGNGEAQEVLSDILSRQALGIDKYGTALRAFNGRNAIKDSYEEALDMCCYLRQAIFEIRAEYLHSEDADNLVSVYLATIRTAVLLRDMLGRSIDD